jgi:hypothetical protein
LIDFLRASSAGFQILDMKTPVWLARRSSIAWTSAKQKHELQDLYRNAIFLELEFDVS